MTVVDIESKVISGKSTVLEQKVPADTRYILITFERQTSDQIEKYGEYPFHFGYSWGDGSGKWAFVESLGHDGGIGKDRGDAREQQRCFVLIRKLPFEQFKPLCIQVFVECFDKQNLVEGQVSFIDRLPTKIVQKEQDDGNGGKILVPVEVTDLANPCYTKPDFSDK